MKVFNLQCEQGHDFEGWFSSGDDYQRQNSGGLLECPMCGSAEVRRLPAAPRLNLAGGDRAERARDERARDESAHDAPGGAEAPAAPAARQLQAVWLELARQIVANTEDVGERFAEEARRIHYNETPERGIRGTASREQARELAEEGIEVFAFPLPQAAKKPLQ